MGRHTRKKQKVADSTEVQPLGVVPDHSDTAAKDEEELRLESMLFGTTDMVAGPSEEHDFFVDDGADYGASGEFDNVMDNELFAVDEPNEEGEEESARTAPQSMKPSDITTTRKTSAWQDEDDATLAVSLVTDKRRRKLRDALAEDTVGGRDYERRLRRQYEKINPTPEWATNARKRLHTSAAKRRRSGTDSETDADEAEVEGVFDSLLSGTGSVLAGRRAKILPHGTLSIERLRDANLSAKAEGEIKVVQFHPSPQVPLLLTASSDRRLRLYTVDGHTNPHLQTLHVPSLPVTNAMFHPSGTSVLLTGPRPFYYTYDLQTGTTQRSPRGLWGTTFANATQAAQDGSMEICAFDSTGSVLAVAGRRGHVHLVDWRTGGGQVVGSVKMNSGAKSLWWSGEQLFSLGEDAEVYVWDVGQRRCIRRWQDDGGYGSQLLTGDRSSKYLAIGSRMGIVNVYGSDAASGNTERPKPLKALGNLTTSITSLKFNHDSQLLAMASNVKKDQMRMIHLPSLTAFSNWPTSSTPLGHVTSVDFSAGSEYVAVGNNRGRVLLYHLRDFSTL
ncbi:WD40 repeat-like protein [Trametes coccinea BRFM310]|uniref:WD40 repeat-like protein n=1 Tax=Trametes coccinea (strain BRFM310) TaxID=1353009 RepID=A0A1Y2IZV2_TRAC3|nr:WD40 repeat-like protein [Trametes coccinea BRFM310]